MRDSMRDRIVFLSCQRLRKRPAVGEEFAKVTLSSDFTACTRNRRKQAIRPRGWFLDRGGNPSDKLYEMKNTTSTKVSGPQLKKIINKKIKKLSILSYLPHRPHM